VHLCRCPLPARPLVVRWVPVTGRRARRRKVTACGAGWRVVREGGLRDPVSGGDRRQVAPDLFDDDLLFKDLVTETKGLRREIEISGRRGVERRRVLGPDHDREVGRLDTIRRVAEILVDWRVGPDVTIIRLLGAADVAGLATPRQFRGRIVISPVRTRGLRRRAGCDVVDDCRRHRDGPARLGHGRYDGDTRSW